MSGKLIGKRKKVEVVLLVLFRRTMKVNFEKWKIKRLIDLRNSIDPKPQYQRTEVWDDYKKQLLLDTILRGYDLPKFYLNKLENNPHYDYEITDGQQRVSAILDFVDGNITLLDSTINDLGLSNPNYKDLKPKTNFHNFMLHVSILEDATKEEVRTLFARLQMGVQLNPVEKRHALASNLGTVISSIVKTNKFFKNSKISNKRFKHQDYMDHVFGIILTEFNKNIKARELDQLYRVYSTSSMSKLKKVLSNANKVLKIMNDIVLLNPKIFNNKWAFVDVFAMIYKNLDKIQSCNHSSFKTNFEEFESKRVLYSKEENLEFLISDPASITFDKSLYNYILAFKTQGSLSEKYNTRISVLERKFLNLKNFSLK